MNLKKQYKLAVEAYYAGKPIMTDDQFDRLENRIKKEDPNWVGFKRAGTNKVTKKTKIKLSHFMPSLSKCYPHEIDGWLGARKGPWIITPKLDGSSVQATYRNGRLVQLVTRGDGVTGKDITFLAKYTTLPQKIRVSEMVVRCEAIMTRDNWKNHYSKVSENPRNLVAGVLNRKLDADSEHQLRHVRFVVLGVFGMPYREGLAQAVACGFEVVHHVLKRQLSGEYLSQLLTRRRTSYQYEIDGLVVVPANRVFEYENEERPKWTTAFKENLSDDDAPTVKVLQVIWQTSRAGRLTPKIEIEPTRLDGVTITHATAHNAHWLLENGVGVGAKIKLVRSGGVIPKIQRVVRKAKPALPDCEYKWVGKYLYQVRPDEQTSKYKRAEYFLTTCGVEGIRYKTLVKIGLDVVGLCKLSSAKLGAQQGYLLKRGFKGKSAENIISSLAALQKGVELRNLLVGSGVFTMVVGDKKLSAIEAEVPLERLVRKGADAAAGIKGMGGKTLEVLERGLQDFRPFYDQIKEYIPVKAHKKEKAVDRSNTPLNGMIATWTGYRDKQQEQEWVANGGIVASFSAKTQVLFYKEGGKASSKIETARKRGAQVCTWGKRPTKYAGGKSSKNYSE